MNTVAYRRFENIVTENPQLVARLAAAPDRETFVSRFIDMADEHGCVLVADEVEAGIDEDLASARARLQDDDLETVAGSWLYKGNSTGTSNFVCCNGSCK